MAGRITYGDSREAATVVNQKKFDGVFLEVDMNGFELAKMVRQSSPNKYTPIVMVTRLEESDTMYEAFAAGGTFFLKKPVDRSTLVNFLETIQQPLFEGAAQIHARSLADRGYLLRRLKYRD